jgi:surface antigen
VAAALVCSGTTSCTKTQVGLSVAALAAAVVVTTVVITRTVENQHHSLQGCLFTSPGGVELHTSDAKVYVLEGESTSLKVGDRVKLHGSKLKKKDSTSGQVFVVEKLNKDYGTCP